MPTEYQIVLIFVILAGVMLAFFREWSSPDVVAVVSHSYREGAYGVIPRPDWPSTQGLTDLELVEVATVEAIDVFAAQGATVVIIEPIPDSSFNVAACLSGAALIEECQFVVESWPPADTELYRSIADERDDTRTADITDLSCRAFPVCSAIVDGVQVREDRDHLYGAYVLGIGPALMERVGI